jgi:hypothetical protein
MKFKADIATCEDGRDQILSVCQSNPDGDVLHEIIIQCGPKEFDFLTESPGPLISCEALGLDLEPGPESVRFSGDVMTIVVAGHEGLEVDLSPLDNADRKALREVAKLLFE